MYPVNKTSILLAFALVALATLLLAMSIPASAAPHMQLTPFPTPTPGPDGRILYIVQPGDTLWRVSAITGVSLDELRALNNLGTEQVIVEGQTLLLGLAGPAETVPTLGPIPTDEPLLPTPTPQPGSGTLCVLVFLDSNGDSVRQEDEQSIPGGQVSVSDRSGIITLTETTTTGSEPHCFTELPEGDYNISVAVPEGYNPTTVMNYALTVDAGAETYIDFGAQPNSQALSEAPTPQGSGQSPLMGILGGLLLAGGVALGIFAGLLRRKGGQGSKE